MGISSVFCFKSGSTGFLGLIDFEYISMVFKYSFIYFIHVSTVFWLCCEGISSVFVSTIVDDACVYMVRYLFGVPFFFQEVFQGCLMGVTRLPCCTRLKYYKKLCLLLLLLVLYLSFNQLPSSVEFSNFPLIFLPNQYFYSFLLPLTPLCFPAVFTTSLLVFSVFLWSSLTKWYVCHSVPLR